MEDIEGHHLKKKTILFSSLIAKNDHKNYIRRMTHLIFFYVDVITEEIDKPAESCLLFHNQFLFLKKKVNLPYLTSATKPLS